MSISTLAVSMAGMSANAANIVECYDAVSVETIKSLSNYDLVMGTATFSFVDHSWQNDSVTYSANISIGENTYQFQIIDFTDGEKRYHFELDEELVIQSYNGLSPEKLLDNDEVFLIVTDEIEIAAEYFA